MITFREAEEALTNILSSDDLLTRGFTAGGVECGLIYLDALSDKLLLEQNIIAPLTASETFEPTADHIQKIIDYGEPVNAVETLNEAASVIADGDIIIVADGAETFFSISLKKFNFRSVSEPPTETVLKGPREGFVEEIKTNISLIRRRLKTPDLRVKQFKVGQYSNTTVILVYIDGVADPAIVQRISERVEAIDIDGIISTSYVEKFIENFGRSIFTQAGITEKPDIVTAKLLEGRIAVVVDGSPVVATFPYLMLEGIQDSYDYYTRDARSSFLRVLRIMGAMFSLLLPGLYVAFQEYHYHLLPLKFLITILNSVNGIPFTPPMEMLFVLLLFEILYQASVRMPRYVGTALSIVGAIVLGETAVSAGLISSPTVLIIAISAIGINCTPDLADTFSLLRVAVLLIGSVLGLFGIVLFCFALVAYLVGMESFGTPYLAPFAPIIGSDMKDSVLKDNLFGMTKRPYSVSTDNRRRMKSGK